MNRTTILASIAGVLLGAGAWSALRSEPAAAQAARRPGRYAAVALTNASFIGVFQIDTETGAMKYCSSPNVGWRCTPVADSAN